MMLAIQNWLAEGPNSNNSTPAIMTLGMSCKSKSRIIMQTTRSLTHQYSHGCGSGQCLI